MSVSPNADSPELVHLRAAGVSLVLDCSGGRLPRILHWGADLGVVSASELEALAVASIPPVASGCPDLPVPLAVLPEQSSAWMGTPGVTGHRDGAHFSTRFAVSDVSTTVAGSDRDGPHRDGSDAGDSHGGDQQLRILALDPTAKLSLELVIQLLPTGLLRSHATLTNAGEDLFDLSGIDLAYPVPLEADQILDFTGRHLRERAPQRRPFTLGTHLRESRRARAHDGTIIMAAGRTGFGFEHGEVWGIHVAWSGNTRTLAERLPSGDGMLAAGELLLAGEIRLAPGESYRTPDVYGSYGDGLDQLSARFHRHLRARAAHPRSPRPVLLNVWEAVYFDHDLDRLKALADLAAQVGVERYVLDDGWFRHRRGDHAGLGDWYVDETVWHEGLSPIVEYVRGLGMQFGLWFEPEMVNPDSDLARAHPDWIFAPAGRLPPEARSQQVLDLGHPAAYDHVLDRLDAILSDYPIDYVKWDHNRDLVEPAHSTTGRAGVHEQTLAVYRMIDELRARHPGMEIESCAGGGGRPDLGIMSRTDRLWTSDCIDALERQQIECWTGLLLPPEMLGSHIGSPVSHTTGRRHELSFRAGTAMFGHLGIEWDLTAATSSELAEVAGWVAAYKEHRDLLHAGDVVRADGANPALWVHGVVSQDRSEAIFAVTALTAGVWAPPGRIRLPGLDPDASYLVRPLPPGDALGRRIAAEIPTWWSGGVTLSGRTLARVGLQAPNLHPEHLSLLHLTRS